MCMACSGSVQGQANPAIRCLVGPMGIQMPYPDPGKLHPALCLYKHREVLRAASPLHLRTSTNTQILKYLSHSLLYPSIRSTWSIPTALPFSFSFSFSPSQAPMDRRRLPLFTRLLVYLSNPYILELIDNAPRSSIDQGPNHWFLSPALHFCRP